MVESRPSGTSDPPRIRIRPDAIRDNAAAVADRFDGRVVGVTKAVTGDPVVATAMLAGGLEGLADARVPNLAALDDDLDAETTMLVGPMREEVDRLVRVADRSLHTELAAVEAVGDAAVEVGRPHEVILMVDMGDRREGVLPGDATAVARDCDDVRGVDLVGLGTNFGCFGGVLPTREKMAAFAEVVDSVEQSLARELPVVSGGSSASLPLVEDGTLPDRITELRVGEAILLGTDVSRDRTIPYLRRDAFELEGEVIECRRKPSVPEGETGSDVAGERSDFEDRGSRRRALLAMGRLDAVPAGLEPLDPGVEVLGASSDHTVLDVHDAGRVVTVGDTLRFRPSYQALVRASTSEYVTRCYDRPEPGDLDDRLDATRSSD